MSVKSIQETIRRRMVKQPPWRAEVGREREQRVLAALTELKDKGKIRDFLPTGKLDIGDLGGIDCYAILIGESSRITVPISVTGPRWVKKHKDIHPDIPVVAVDGKDTIEQIKQKLLDIFAGALPASG